MGKLARKRILTAVSLEARLLYGTFFYNSCSSAGYIAETLAEPIFWVLDRTIKPAGPLFVLLVCLLTAFVVAGFYTLLLPVKWAASNAAVITVYLLLAHWLLVNIVFHYWMAVKTSPGVPPPAVQAVVSICKLCIAPKPPRTHHCGICGRCILKMDHHCPWLNNCVGHNNHRYFFLFMVYMQLGSAFVCLSSYEQFYDRIFLRVSSSGETSTKNTIEMGSTFYFSSIYSPTEHSGSPEDRHTPFTDISVVILFLLCLGAAFSLTMLIGYHSFLVTRGETSIEKHINAKERSRLEKQGQPFTNVYSAGWKENWKQFLGLYQGRTVWRHVLLPSKHPPYGDGVTWTVKCD